MALGARARQRRQELGLTQYELAKKVGVTQGAIYQLEKRDNPTFRNIFALAEALKVSPEWLIGMDAIPEPQPDEHSPTERELDAASTLEPNVDMQLPFLVEVASSNGIGSAEVREESGLPAPLAMVLAKNDIRHNDATYAVISGDSMGPVMPDGSIVCIDKSDKTVAEGRIYALDHGGQLRIKKLIRLPGNGLRVASLNPDYEPEDYSRKDLESGELKIIGRVFWYSATI